MRTRPRPGPGGAHRSLVADRRQHDPMGNNAVPRGMQIAAAWAWRVVALAAAAWVLQVIARTQLVLVPVLVALLLAALLQPIAAALVKRGVPRALAAALVLIGRILGIAGLVWLLVDQFRGGFGDLSAQVDDGIAEIQDWLINGPLELSQTQIDNAFECTQLADRQPRASSPAAPSAPRPPPGTCSPGC